MSKIKLKDERHYCTQCIEDLLRTKLEEVL